MIKEIKYFLYVLTIILFTFFSVKYYFSDTHKKKSYRSIQSNEEKIVTYSENLPVLKNDTDNIVNEFSGIIAIPVLVLIGFTHLDAHPFEQVSNKAFTFHAVQVPLLQGEVAVHVETACCFSDV